MHADSQVVLGLFADEIDWHLSGRLDLVRDVLDRRRSVGVVDFTVSDLRREEPTLAGMTDREIELAVDHLDTAGYPVSDGFPTGRWYRFQKSTRV